MSEFIKSIEEEASGVIGDDNLLKLIETHVSVNKVTMSLEDFVKYSTEILSKGMTLRQNQLNCSDFRSGNQILAGHIVDKLS